MKSTVKIVLLVAVVTACSARKTYAQVSPNDQQKKDSSATNRTPRKNTNQPPITGNNKKAGIKDDKSHSPGNSAAKNDSLKTIDHTPRTYTDQPPIKEVPKNYGPSNTKKKKQHVRQAKDRRPPPGTGKGRSE